MIDILGYTCTTLLITGFVLNSRRNSLCFPVWIISDIGWIIYSILTYTYPHAITCLVLVIVNAYGWYEWRTKKIINKIKE